MLFIVIGQRTHALIYDSKVNETVFKACCGELLDSESFGKPSLPVDLLFHLKNLNTEKHEAFKF